MSWPSWPDAICTGAPVMPFSLPFVSRKWRDTASERVSISTIISSIMHAE